MIIVQLSGNLGNQMFQYALGRRLSLIHHTDLKLDIAGFETSQDNYKLDRFHIRASVAEKKDVSQLINLHLLRGGEKTVDPALFPARTNIEENPYIVTLRDNTYLTGQCWTLDYFNSIAKTLRKELREKTRPEGLNKKYLRQIAKEQSVSIYICRGGAESDDLRALPTDYYYRAVEYVANRLKKPAFYIFSDDPAWCKQHFSINYPCHFVDHNDAAALFEDFRLMRSCKHNIIANAPLSWWSAWLNPNPKKLVVAPKNWFADARDAEEFLPRKWIRLDND